MTLQPVILCGGSGTRLWPLSRERYPKQLLPLDGERTLLQDTALRAGAPGVTIAAPLVVCNEEYRFLTAEQLRQIDVQPASLLLEPVGRNTAPALALAALAASAADPVLLVMPSDHVIRNTGAFREAVALGAAQAEAGAVVTFGITPDKPETGYGYIRTGAQLAGGPARTLDRFVEKPDAATAEAYLASGDYLWNAGIFMMKASVALALLKRFRPDIEAASRTAYERGAADHDFYRIDKAAFAACPSDSIDYAIMEPLAAGEPRVAPAVVVPLDAGWSDVGAWDALWQVAAKDADGNVSRGDVLLQDTQDSLVFAETRMVSCLGMKDVVVVETCDAVMVVAKNRTQDVKRIVAHLKANKRPEAENHRKVYRPWGYYDSIDAGSRFQVKRIVVNPGASLSLQMHHHRAEHWIVVSGTARVTCGENILLLSENQSTYIPLGTTHRLENPGKLPLEMIEVQSGSYLGEDDIVRFEDTYGRK
ncbi:mannose-1-phosphate guanylyltransferase/mannose-6-phosphate isomerase [Methyloversatilis sp. XJ19-13]|uniref:mannose-1-phosphate guanylyltransferase/mannose-6-phosphate isomerase n=1 Tax=Methyloversatilis sp. XJ19-13 TaxID=2963430 RepID=UPI00211C0184|nr:mannose-1-phosphate guanylyltransferase/mannose-6-phosphate isomerase [Methyloversatilis sp. XJ19-13]MCQ9372958.1 mannose-1-phosphate guanylyltransferase/mannose-6-phosphate isomerase [Methyloversatilis sp. XJ19-13]